MGAVGGKMPSWKLNPFPFPFSMTGSRLSTMLVFPFPIEDGEGDGVARNPTGVEEVSWMGILADMSMVSASSSSDPSTTSMSSAPEVMVEDVEAAAAATDVIKALFHFKLFGLGMLRIEFCLG